MLRRGMTLMLMGACLMSACSKSEPPRTEATAEQAPKVEAPKVEEAKVEAPVMEAPPTEADSTLVEMVKAGGHVMPPKGTVSSLPTPESKASPEFDQAFATLLQTYYGVRAPLAGDNFNEAHGAGEKMKDALALLRKAPSPAVTDGEKANVVKQFDALDGAIDALVKGADIAAQREAFALISKPIMYIVAYHYHGDTPQIFFCPMKNLAWMQDNPKMGNPYYGAQMLECGLKVKKS